MTITDKNKCIGCGVCFQVCPTDAISMKSDSEGFLYPLIEENKCISCKNCVKTCPVENVPSRVEPTEIYAARAKDEDIVARSSSGGMFSILAESIICGGGAVYGAGFDEDFNVLHKGIEKTEDIPLLTGSKYVQSDLRNTYKEIKAEADKGRKVLFAGTPCQSAGLVRFLGKEYSNVFIVDFICHGVPSAGLYRKYLEFMSGEKDIVSVNFRDKKHNRKTGLDIAIVYADSTEYRKAFVHDPYMLAFLQNISLRKSCYSCQFKNFHSGSDITIGDFWHLDKTDSVLSDKNGVSLVMLNTEKGKGLFEVVKAKVDADCRTLGEAKKGNHAIVGSVSPNPLREKYLRDMHKLSIDKLSDKYCGSSLFAKARRAVAKLRKDR